ncbi:MAG: PIN domain-containing protein, partial [bacterium]|nr:PIN domain-containing protein [bacterium]
MNIVLDTNCLIMSISPRSIYRSVWQVFLNGGYTLCISNEIVEEYAEVLARNISPRVSEAIMYALLTRPNIMRKDPHFSFGLIEADRD